MSNIKTFRLFISSPFSDFKEERHVLHTKVFPQVEKHCSDEGFQFQPIDLRWGVNNESQLDQKTLSMCLDEVKACKYYTHPHFLIMQGDRYGYIPLPYQIEVVEFETIFKVLSKLEKELLSKWYKLDANQIPASYTLEVRQGKYEEYALWEQVEIELRELFQKAVKKTFTDKDDKEYQKYFLSATEQEVIEGICDYNYKTDAQKDCDGTLDKEYIFGFLRTPKKESEDKAKQFRKKLKNTLLKENTLMIDDKKDYLLKFEEFMLEKLKASVSKQIEIYSRLERTPLYQEKSEQEIFKNNKSKNFTGRKKAISSINKYLSNNSDIPLVIYGPSGMGKSALMAHSISLVEKQNDVIYRFVGATGNSSNIRNLLISIADELQLDKIINKIEKYESNINKFNIQIQYILNQVNKKVVIYIDALDQLQFQDYLQWLPDVLSKNLKIVISVLHDKEYEKDSKYYALLLNKYNNRDNFINIMDESLEKEALSLIVDLLKIEDRILNDSQKIYLFQKFQKSNFSPLYLKIAIEEVKHWKSSDWSEKCIPTKEQLLNGKEQKLNDSVIDIIKEYILNLTSIYHIETKMVEKVLGYIVISKDGLSEKELIDLLSENLEDEESFSKVIFNKFHDPIKKENLNRNNEVEYSFPISIWSRIHTLMKPFLVEKDIDDQALINFFHRQFFTVVEDIFKEKELFYHKTLENYFMRVSFKKMLQNDEVINTLRNYMYHLSVLKKYEKLEQLIIMFETKIKQQIYKDNINELIDIYSFDSMVPEIKKLQFFKYILNVCFIKNQDNKYEKKSLNNIKLDASLEEYGITNFDEIFKDMISSIGIEHFEKCMPQIESIDKECWLKEYNYVQITLGLMSDYIDFDSSIVRDRECKNCRIIRREDQLNHEHICGKCLVDENDEQKIVFFFFIKSDDINDNETYKNWMIENNLFDDTLVKIKDDYNYDDWKTDKEEKIVNDFNDLSEDIECFWSTLDEYIANDSTADTCVEVECYIDEMGIVSLNDAIYEIDLTKYGFLNE